jgi:hypothetical protein
MKSQSTKHGERIRALLMRRVADRLALPATCQARACQRNKRCNSSLDTHPSCRHAASADDRARFDQLFDTIEAIRNLTLWPEPSRSDDLRAVEAMAIDILVDALPLMPDFVPKFQAWLVRYNTWPTRPRDSRFWLKLAKEEIARWREVDRVRAEAER